MSKSGESAPSVENTPQKPVGGRPTKYDSSFVEEVDIYIEETLKSKTPLPTIEGFARRLGVDDTTLVNWSNARQKDEDGKKLKKRLHPDFFASIKRLKSIQREQLIKEGMYSRSMPTTIMSIFLLKANHDMVETTHTDLTTKGEKLPAPVPILGGSSNVPIDNSDS